MQTLEDTVGRECSYQAHGIKNCILDRRKIRDASQKRIVLSQSSLPPDDPNRRYESSFAKHKRSLCRLLGLPLQLQRKHTLPRTFQPKLLAWTLTVSTPLASPKQSSHVLPVDLLGGIELSQRVVNRQGLDVELSLCHPGFVAILDLIPDGAFYILIP